VDESILSMIFSIDFIGNRTRDLPACSAVPHPTAPPRATIKVLGTYEIYLFYLVRYLKIYVLGAIAKSVDGIVTRD
jgi:hypothetical protein